MKPKIHLNGSLGLLMIGIGVMPVFFIAIEMYELYSRSLASGVTFNRSYFWEWEILSILGLGLGFLLSGFGLVFKFKRAPFFASLFILLGALWWSYFIYSEFRHRGFDTPDFWIEMSIFIFVYTLLFFGLAFLGNEKVKEDYGEMEESHWDDNILDV